MNITHQTLATSAESTLDLAPIFVEAISRQPNWGQLAGAVALILLGIHVYVQAMRRAERVSRLYSGLLAILLGSLMLLASNMGPSAPPANTEQAEQRARTTAAVALPMIIQQKYGLEASNTCDFPLGAAAYDKVCAVKLTDRDGEVFDGTVRVMGDDFEVTVLIDGLEPHPVR